MNLHEQARAEAEKRWPGSAVAGRRYGFVEGFLAGHEAATRTREVTTVAELDALPEASVVLDQHQDPWQKSEGGWDSPNPYLPHPWSNERLASTGPLTVLYEPEESEMSADLLDEAGQRAHDLTVDPSHLKDTPRILRDLVERVQAAEEERDSVQFALDGARTVARKGNEYLIAERDEARGKLDTVRALANEAPDNLLDELRTLLAILDGTSPDV